jgi:hypothetical protein
MLALYLPVPLPRRHIGIDKAWTAAAASALRRLEKAQQMPRDSRPTRR